MTEAQTLKAMRRAWGMTKQRCFNPKQRDYPRYGGRGITVCERWMNFDLFLEDMGLRPEGHTLEREKNDVGYQPGNCIWADRKTQCRNRDLTMKIEVGGVLKTVAEWSEATGIGYHTIKARLRRLNYSPIDCLTKTVKCGEMLDGRSGGNRKHKKESLHAQQN